MVTTEELRDGRVQLSEVELHYVEGPNAGPPMVFLHGIGLRWQSWEAVIPSFVDGYHVFGVDLRGSGESGRTPERYGHVNPVVDIVELLSEVVGQPAIMIGHSWGAVISAQVAAQAPEAVKAVVLEDPPFYRGDGTRATHDRFRALDALLRREPSRDEIEQTVRELGPNWSEAAVAETTASLAALDPTIYGEVVSGDPWKALDIENVLPRLACPTLLVHGDPDFPQIASVLKAEDVVHVGETIPRCTVKPVGDVGHRIHIDQRDRFLEVVKEFLATIE